MHVLQFIQANFWTLLAMCGVVFLLGITLWIIGTVMMRQGQKTLMWHAQMDALERQGRGPFAPSRQGLESEYVYPPVMEHEYWPIED